MKKTFVIPNTTSNVTVSNDDTDDAFDAMMNAQIEVNEDRLNKSWENQTTDDTYRRGTYEPEKNNNSYDDNYDDIFSTSLPFIKFKECVPLPPCCTT